jgi:hypothetical protein
MTTNLPGLSPSISDDIVQRQPSNTNYIQNTGFFFGLQRLPNVKYFCQEANLPGLNFNEVIQPTRFINVKHPGNKITYEQLEISFIVDEDLSNWREVHDWMKSIVNIESVDEQIAPADQFSDATLILLNSAMRENVRVKFKGCFPISLTGLRFLTTPAETEPQMATMSLVYDTYNIEKV